MDAEGFFPSRFLKSGDFSMDTDTHLKIERVEVEAMEEGGTEKKPVLFFTAHEKGLVLNRTNTKVLIKAFGRDTDRWVGKSVTVYIIDVQFKGDVVEGIRLRVPRRSLIETVATEDTPAPEKRSPNAMKPETVASFDPTVEVNSELQELATFEF